MRLDGTTNPPAPVAATAQPRPMNWERLPRIHPEPFFDKKLQAEIPTRSQEADRLSDNRQKFEKEQARIAGQDPAAVDFDNVALWPARRSAYLQLLQDDVKYRRAIAPLFEMVSAAYAAQADKIFNALQVERARVRKGLAELGFIDVGEDLAAAGPTIGAITPGMIFTHPRVRALYDEQESLRNKAGASPQAAENVNALHRVLEQLESCRRQALAVAG